MVTWWSRLRALLAQTYLDSILEYLDVPVGESTGLPITTSLKSEERLDIEGARIGLWKVALCWSSQKSQEGRQ